MLAQKPAALRHRLLDEGPVKDIRGTAAGNRHAKKRPRLGLTKNDFQVFEDGVQQDITFFY